MIEERDELATRHRQRGVRGRRDARIHRQVADADPRVVLVLAQRLDRFRRRRGVVAHAQFPVGVDLPPDRVDAGAQPLWFGVVDRGHDADEGLQRQALRPRVPCRRGLTRRACGARPSARRLRRRAPRFRTFAAARSNCEGRRCARAAQTSAASSGLPRADDAIRCAARRKAPTHCRPSRQARLASRAMTSMSSAGSDVGGSGIVTVCQRRSVHCSPGSMDTFACCCHSIAGTCTSRRIRPVAAAPPRPAARARPRRRMTNRPAP